MFHIRGVFVFLIVVQRPTCVILLSLCDTDDGYLEVENKLNNRFTCRNITATSTVSWLVADVYGNDVDLGTCPPPTSSQQSTCSASTLAPVFMSYRTSSDVSFLSVDVTGGNPKRFAGLPLTCRTETNYARCLMDYVYPASNVSCKVQFTNTYSWSVSGQCNITQIFSERGRYRCRIYENQEPKSDRKLIDNSTMSTTTTGVDASSGNCAFRSNLPLDGRYNYRVVVVPGEVEFPFVFTGSNEIRKPPVPPSHNCPDVVKEGQDIHCTCSVSDYGAPSGTLQWDNTGSTQLNLTGVTKEDTGRRFACRLTWNNTDVWTVNYTLSVTYPAGVLSFKVNNSTNTSVTVDENTPLMLSCEANGRPIPLTSLINDRDQVLSSVPVGDLVTPDIRKEVAYNFSKIQCPDGGSFGCDVDNGVGRDSKSVMVLVQCSPSAFTSDNQFPSVTFRDKEELLQFNLTAYPTPEVVSIAYLGLSGIGVCTGIPVPRTAVSAECSGVKGRFSSVVCTATIHNVTSDDAGIYRVTVRNSLGQLELVFEVKTGETESEQQPLSTDGCSRCFASGIGVGVGITVGVFAILHVAGVIWLWRRKWVLPCRRVTDNAPVRSGPFAEAKDSPDYLSEGSGNAYDALRLKEVGMKSEYSSLRTENQSGLETRESTDYESTTEATPTQVQQVQRQRRTQPTASRSCSAH